MRGKEVGSGMASRSRGYSVHACSNGAVQLCSADALGWMPVGCNYENVAASWTTLIPDPVRAMHKADKINGQPNLPACMNDY